MCRTNRMNRWSGIGLHTPGLEPGLSTGCVECSTRELCVLSMVHLRNVGARHSEVRKHTRERQMMSTRVCAWQCNAWHGSMVSHALSHAHDMETLGNIQKKDRQCRVHEYMIHSSVNAWLQCMYDHSACKLACVHNSALRGDGREHPGEGQERDKRNGHV